MQGLLIFKALGEFVLYCFSVIFNLNVAIHFMFVYMVYFVEFGIKPFEYSHFIGWVKIFGYFK